MIRSSLSTILLIGCGLASCGDGDVCERAADIDCDGPAPDVEQCQENLEDCSAEDIDHLEAYLDCWDDAGLQCVTDPTADEITAMETCIAELEGVSDACQVSTSTAGS